MAKFVRLFNPQEPMKITIAIDSFKGCLTSLEAGQAAADGVRAQWPDAIVQVWPVSDGGEGFARSMATVLQARPVEALVHDPLMRPCTVTYWLSSDGREAWMDAASCLGLPLVEKARLNPMMTTSYGLGELMLHAWRGGATRIVLGLGGTSTCDGGLGLMQALGYRIHTTAGREAKPGGRALAEVSCLSSGASALMPEPEAIVCACDVSAPMTGPNGAALQFSPQKGATPAMTQQLEQGMTNLSQVIERDYRRPVRYLPMAGAAGGIAGMLHGVLGARLEPGARLMLDVLRLDERWAGTDLVLTGEGRADVQTTLGKMPMEVCRSARRRDIPVALLAGSVADEPLLRQAGFRYLCPINPPGFSLEQAMRPDVAKARLGQAAARVVQQYLADRPSAER